MEFYLNIFSFLRKEEILFMELKNMQNSEKSVLNQEISKEKINSKYIYHSIKRVLDILGSIFGLVILTPLFLIIIILMKLEEPTGPIFFSQIRVGKNEKKFRMFKFRSMC